jgi:flagellar basal body-associated protein FliL
MAWDAIERLKLERVFSYKRFSEVRSPEQLQKQIERRIEEIYGRVD